MVKKIAKRGFIVGDGSGSGVQRNKYSFVNSPNKANLLKNPVMKKKGFSVAENSYNSVSGIDEGKGDGSKKIPLKVKVISIIYFLSSGVALVAGFVLLGLGILGKIPEYFIREFPRVGKITLIVIGIVNIIFMFLYFFAGELMWRGRKIAKFLVITASVASIIFYLVLIFLYKSYIVGISGVVLYSVILAYFLLIKSIKEFLVN